MRVLFVCTGNTCRSPMAETLARAWLEAHQITDIEVESAGLVACEGDAASEGARRAMAAADLTLQSHRARQLTMDMVRAADLVLTMTTAHAQSIRNRVPGVQVEALAEYAGETGNVPDPYGGDDTQYAACAARVYELVAKAMARLTAERKA